jgi:hypothetical protein
MAKEDFISFEEQVNIIADAIEARLAVRERACFTAENYLADRIAEAIHQSLADAATPSPEEVLTADHVDVSEFAESDRDAGRQDCEGESEGAARRKKTSKGRIP